MLMTGKESWTILHGLLFGGLTLFSVAALVFALLQLRSSFLTDAGKSQLASRLKYSLLFSSLCSWLTVLLGTFVVYPWYREDNPYSPRSLLLADVAHASWHRYGMEWKEHVAWMVPILLTTVAFMAIRHASLIWEHHALRRLMTFFLFIALASAVTAGLLGALINKIAPVI